MTGVAVGRVNRDYDTFFKTARGSSPTSAPKTSAANLPRPPVPSAALVQPPDSPAESEHRKEKEPPAATVRHPPALKPALAKKPSKPTHEWRAGPGEERLMINQKRTPPPKPPPYSSILQRSPSEVSKPQQISQLVRTAKETMPYWYRPQYLRDEAINFLRSLDPGSFILRDSSSVTGGYALTIKVSPEDVRRRKKMPEDAPVTEDMLMIHFLIQPDSERVKLQGSNERAFKTLPEFIAHHTVEKLCLPCKLVLPGAKCELVYLGSIDVSGPGSESVVRETVEQLKTLRLSTMNIVTFKASMSGITFTDNISGMYIKRQYPMSSITYCGLDPNDTRCFGLVLRPPDSMGNSCLVFGEFDSSQPVTSVVNYLQRAMRRR